jgi:hypothetical protein
MVERREREHLGIVTLELLGGVTAEDLDRDGPLEPLVHTAEDVGNGPAAQAITQLITAIEQASAGSWLGGGHPSSMPNRPAGPTYDPLPRGADVAVS